MLDGLPWWKERYAYCKIPKALFLEERYRYVSPLAKLLYAFLMDRTSLSFTRGEEWKTEDGACFVYFPLTEIMERLGCGRDKASALLNELEGAKLITRTLKGRGRPYRITVQPFVLCGKVQTYRGVGCRDKDVDKSGKNKTETINTDVISTDSLMASGREGWRTIVEEYVNYNVLLTEIPKEQLDGVINIITDVLAHGGSHIKIFGEEIPKSEIQRRFLMLNDMHIRYVCNRLMKETNNIHNLRGYIIARLYEADDVMDSYYQIQVNRDNCSGKEKR